MSIEQSVKTQFAKVFLASDWPLFKKMAELNIQEAARLQKRQMPIDEPLRLLARNSRKRLLIGIGVELLLKAVYLKHNYMINKPPPGSPLTFPFLATEAAGIELRSDQTFMLDRLIEKLPDVVDLRNKDQTLKGLKIAKVFRNKEGHGVTSDHKFDASNYSDIEFSLSELYRDAFNELLSVQFSFEKSEKAIWKVSQHDGG